MCSMDLKVNAGNQASYYSASQIIELSEISREKLICLLEKPDDDIDAYKTVCHEIRHLFDNVGTYMGFKFLTEIYDAYNTFEKKAKLEGDYSKIYRLHNRFRNKENLFCKEVINEKYDYKSKELWYFKPMLIFQDSYENNMGIKNMAIYNQFYYNNEIVAKIPFSMESFWETNAFVDECLYHYKYILRVKENDKIDAMIELKDLNKLIDEWMYDTDKLIYTSLLHLVVRTFNFDNRITAFYLTRILSTIALNIPEKYYSQIKKPINIFDRFEEELINRYVEQFDPGFVFICLIFNLRDVKVEFKDTDIDIDNILSCSNLPTQEDLEKEIIELYKNLSVNKEPGIFDKRYNDYFNFGIRTFYAGGLTGEYNYCDFKYSTTFTSDRLCEEGFYVECTERNMQLCRYGIPRVCIERHIEAIDEGPQTTIESLPIICSDEFELEDSIIKWWNLIYDINKELCDFIEKMK